jgi:hypothetical protein
MVAVAAVIQVQEMAAIMVAVAAVIQVQEMAAIMEVVITGTMIKKTIIAGVARTAVAYQ